MSEEAKPQAVLDGSAPADSLPHLAEVRAEAEAKHADVLNGTITNGDAKEGGSKAITSDAPDNASDQSSANDKPISEEVAQNEPATTQEAMKNNDEIKEDAAPTAESADMTVDVSASASKAKARRKSSGVPEHKGKKLNKKASKAKMTHTDAKPGDYFYVRLKGYPLWPAIVCDESMLPTTLIKSRPVTAARPDGTYRADYEDGGVKVKDRTFPVMYLHTNEFGWIPNFDLLEIDFEDVTNISANMRKDLAAARLLAAEKHDLDYFKDILKNFMEARQADIAAKEAAKAEKKAKSAAAKKEKKSSKTVEVEDEEDIDMPDAPAELDDQDGDVSSEKKTKKRPADEPLPVESPKKIKVKLTTTPKATNGVPTPKSVKDKSTTKSAKPKTKKSAPKTETPEIVIPKEPELTAEEKRVKKEKEILFLRHKLQKGLLNKDQEPKVEEMKQMSEYVGKLEGYSDLEVSIIRATKINKVLKAILKLPMIPKEEEYMFKTRSQILLDKWNKLLATEPGAPSTSLPATNGTSDAKNDAEDAKESPTEGTNGTKESSAEEKLEEKHSVPETKEAPAETSTIPSLPKDETIKDATTDATMVESTA